MSNDFDELEALLREIEGGDDFDIDSGKPDAKDRNPVSETAKQVAGSAFRATFPEGRRREIVSKALPDSYSEANDRFREIEFSSKQLYSHTKEEFMQTKREIQRKAQRLAPTISKYLPRGMAQKFTDWAAEGGSEHDDGKWWQEDRAAAEVEDTVAQIFGNKQQPVQNFYVSESSGEETDPEKVAETELKEFNKDMRSQSMEESLINIRGQIERIANNELMVNTSWRRKSLEVGLRQLFALSDILKITKESSERMVPAIESIVKNTALPDYAKENVDEIALAMSKRRLIESVNPAEYARTFITDFTNKAAKKISDTFKDIRGGMDMSDMSDTFGGMEGLISEEEMAQLKRSMGIDIVTSELAERYINPRRDKALAWMKEKTKDVPVIKELGERLKYYTKNVSSIYNTELTDETEDSVFKDIVNALGEIKEGFNGERLQLKDRDDEFLEGTAVFNQRYYLTQTEIIPAYLKSIDKAVWKVATGEDKNETYDIGQRGFVTDEEFNKRIIKQVTMPTQKRLYDVGLDKMVADFDPDNELSAEGREELKEYFHERIIKDRTFDMKDLSREESLNEIMSDFDDSDIFRERMREMMDEKGNFGAMNEYADRFQKLRSLAGGYQREINRAALTYGDKALIDAGLFEGNGWGGVSARPEIIDYVSRTASKDDELSQNITDVISGKDTVKPRVNEDGIETLNRKIINNYNVDNSNVENSLTSILDTLRSLNTPLGSTGGSTTAFNLADVTTRLDQIKETVSNLKYEGDSDRLEQIMELIATNNKDTSSTLEVLETIRDRGLATAALPEGEAKESIYQRGKKWMRGLPKRGIGATARGGWVATKWTTRNLRRAIKKGVKGAFGGAKDVFNEEGEKVLSGIKLKAGEYYTTTKEGIRKRIFSVDEIEGEVTDKEGNQVLSEEEVENADKFKLMRKGRIRKLSDFLMRKGGWVKDKVMGFGGHRVENITDAVNKTHGFLFDIPDVYVEGEETPRLRSDLIKEGYYFSKGKKIRNTSQITGEIRNKHDKVVISEEEFTSDGFKLVDEKGRPIATRMDRLIGRATKNISDVVNAGRTARDYVTDKAAKLVSKLRKKKDGGEVDDEPEDERESFFKRFFNKAAEVGESARSYDILVKIYNLLNRRLPGDKDEEIPERENLNYDSIKKNVKAKADKVKETIKAKVKETNESEGASKLRKKRDELKEKVTSKARKHKPKVRLARRMANKKKRSFLETAERNRKAATIKAKRAKRNIEREVREDGVAYTVRNRVKEHITNPFKAKLDTGVAKIKERLVSLDEPTDKFNTSKLKVGANDPQMLLLKRIADATEGNWVRGISADAEQDGDYRTRQQVMDRFSRRFKGVLSKYYRGGNDDDNKTKGAVDKATKGGEKKDQEKGFLGTLLSGIAGSMSKGLSSLIEKMAIGAGVSSGLGGLMESVFGGGGVGPDGKPDKPNKPNKGGGVKNAVKNGAKTVLKTAGSFLAGNALWTAGTAAMSAIGSIISAPVALGIAAVAGVSYLAYKHLTKRTPSHPGQVRFAQYGTRDYDNWSEDDALKCIYLEEELNKYCVKKQDGSYVIKGLSKEQANVLAEGYGVDIESEVECNAFGLYLVERFIPLYLLWRSRCSQVEFNGTLQEYENKLPSAKEQLKLLDLTRLSPIHPIFEKRDDPDRADRGWIMSTSDWIGFTDRSLMTGKEVADVTARAIIELEKQARKEENVKKEAKNKASGVAKFNKAQTAKVDSATEKAMSTETAKDAMLAMYGGEDKKPTISDPSKMKSIEPKEDVGNASTTKIRGGIAPIFGNVTPTERLRFYLYGIEVVSQADADSLRRIELQAKTWTNAQTKSVDSQFYSLAMAEIHTMGKIGADEYGDSYESKMTSWLRDRFIPMYFGWYASLSRVVGEGAILAPAITPNVYTSIYALLDLKTEVNGKDFPVITLPGGVDVVGDFKLIKDKVELSKIITGFKPEGMDTKPDKVDKEKSGSKHKSTGDKYIDRLMKKHEKRREKSIAAAKANGTYTENVKVVGPDGKVTTVSSSGGDKSKVSNVDTGGARTPAPSFGTPAISADEGTGDYASFSGRKLESRNDVATMIGDIASAQGIDPDLMISTALMESSLNPNAKARTSSAKGLFQFLDGTWREMLGKFGNKLGIPQNASQQDPVAATLLAGEYFRGNSKYLPENRKGPVDLYMSHFMGPGGARKFLNALNQNPSKTGVSVDRRAANANPSIFFSSRGPKSLGEIYESFAKKMLAYSSKVGPLTSGKYESGMTIQKEDIERKEKRAKAVENRANMDAASSERIVEAMNTKAPAYASTKSAPKPAPATPAPSVSAPPITDSGMTPAKGDPLAPATYINTAAAVERKTADTTVKPQVSPVVTKQTESFVKDHPEATPEDVETYEQALVKREGLKAQGGDALTTATIERIIESATQNKDAIVKVLSAQLGQQTNMVKLLQDISSKLTLSLEKELSSKDIDRMKREDTKPLPFELPPVDMSNNKLNITRNKSI